MSLVSDAIWAASPTTSRGLPTQLSADPKGERIAYASNKSIFLRSIDHPEISKQYNAHTAQTTVGRFAPSGFYVASGDVSGNVKVWDCVGEGATKGDYHIIAGRINDIAWDGDSQRLIAVGDGKERFGHCITADSGNSVGEISGQSAQINCVSIRQQRPLRAATGSDDTSLAFYHGAPFKFNTSLRGQHNKFVFGTAFSPDGASLVSVGSDRKIWLFDGKTGEVRKQIGEGEHTGSIFSVSWSKDSKSFATASADQTVKVWDAEAGKVTQTWRMGEDNVVHVPSQQVGVVWPPSRSDELIISVDLDGNLNYLAKGDRKPLRSIHGHQGNITASGFTSSSEKTATLWTGSYEGRVRKWNIASGQAALVDGESHSNYVSAFASSDSNGRIYSVGWDDTLRTLDSSTSAFVGGVSKTNGQPKDVAVTKNNHVLVATSNVVEIFQDGTKIGDLPLQGFTATSITASPASNVVALGCSDNTIRLYTVSESTLKSTSEIKDPSITSAPSALAISHDGAHLAAGTAAGRICVFDASDFSLVTSRWSAHTARVTSISWSKDGKHAASGSLDTNVFIWSLKSPAKRIKAGNAHKDGVNGIVWDGETGNVLSVGADAAVKVWRVEGLE